MSAVSAPKPDDAPEPAGDADGWALLEGLRRRSDDQAALGRKTAAQVSQLAESIAGLVAQQRRRSLWLNVNSFVAYVMFTVLCAAGCYLLYQSRARELVAGREHAIGERDAAVRRADDATVRGAAREAAEIKAWEIYQLLEAGKRGEAVAKLDALRDQPLTRTERAVLAARVHDTQVIEVDAALKAAIASFKAGRPADVIKPLEAALSVEPAGPRAATLHYYLGVAYARTELDKAAAHLQAAIAGDVDQEDARFQLASVLDRSGAYGQARAEYDRFATAHPQSQLAVFAMRRSATLARLPAVAPPAAGQGTPGGAPAVAGQGAAGVAPAVAGQAPAAARPGVVPGVVAPNAGIPPNAGHPGVGVVPGAIAPNPGVAPSTGRPGVGIAPGAVAPDAGRPGVGIAPGAVAPSAVRPGVGIAPGAVAPNAGRPGVVPGPVAPNAARPGLGVAPGAVAPNAGRAGVGIGASASNAVHPGAAPGAPTAPRPGVPFAPPWSKPGAVTRLSPPPSTATPAAPSDGTAARPTDPAAEPPAGQ